MGDMYGTMLYHALDGGLDVCVDLTGSSPLTQTKMSDFVPRQPVIDVAQRRRGKYMAKCAAIGYVFIPFSFSYLGELGADADTLLKRIQKFFMTQDIGAWRIIPLTVTISGLGQTMNACSRFFAGDIYGDHVVSCVRISGIKHRHNVVRDTLVDICYRYGISASKEVDIGLDMGRDKPLRRTDMLHYSWDGGLDLCVDSPLTQTGMVDFVPGWAVIDATQRKRDNYMAKCVAIGFGFLLFSFSCLEN
nr:hypothetical protein [Tanacetum cinerariifolium]